MDFTEHKDPLILSPHPTCLQFFPGLLLIQWATSSSCFLKTCMSDVISLPLHSTKSVAGYKVLVLTSFSSKLSKAWPHCLPAVRVTMDKSKPIPIPDLCIWSIPSPPTPSGSL